MRLLEPQVHIRRLWVWTFCTRVTREPPWGRFGSLPTFPVPCSWTWGLSVTSPPLPPMPMGASCCEFYDSAWLHGWNSSRSVFTLNYSGFLTLFPCFLVWISFLNDEKKAPPEQTVYKMTAIPWLPLPGAIFFSFPLDFRFFNFSICAAEATPGYSLLDVGFTCKLHRAWLKSPCLPFLTPCSPYPDSSVFLCVIPCPGFIFINLSQSIS